MIGGNCAIDYRGVSGQWEGFGDRAPHHSDSKVLGRGVGGVCVWHGMEQRCHEPREINLAVGYVASVLKVQLDSKG